MPLLTKSQIEKLVKIISQHSKWLTYVLLGDRYIKDEDLQELKRLGFLPTDIQAPTIKYAHVLGKLESVLKRAEWKGLKWDQIVAEAKQKYTPLEQRQIEASELSAYATLRNFEGELQRGVFAALSQSSDKVITEGIVREKIAKEIEAGVAFGKPFREVAHSLIDSFKSSERNWHRVATNELHAARQKGMVMSIVQKEDIYRNSEGVGGDVAVQPNPSACDDCKKMYLGKDGNPKIFKLKELLANEGSNYKRPWRENARPVIPPLHPNCYCVLRYIFPGWGWNEKGRFTVIDQEKHQAYLNKISKGISTLKGKNGDLPTLEHISQMSKNDALQCVRFLSDMAEKHAGDRDKLHEINNLSQAALFRAYLTK